MNKIDKILFNHKIYPNYRGYEYVKEIITYNKSISLINVTDLYKLKADKFNTTSNAVERAVRHTISKSDLKGIANKLALAMLQVECKGEEYEI